MSSNISVDVGYFTITKKIDVEGRVQFTSQYDNMTLPEIIGLLNLEEERFVEEWRRTNASG